MSVNKSDSIKPDAPPQQLPEQGGIIWVTGGVPCSALPTPCTKCIEFLARMNDADLADLLIRIRKQVGPGKGE
jgi:hypothetical protein